VLLYRAATYLPPIPLGAAAFLLWRHAPALIHRTPVSTAPITPPAGVQPEVAAAITPLP
jgi:hypothetical protein